MAFQGGRGTAQAGQVEAAPDLSGMIFHHLLDGHELEFEFLGRGWVIHLPEWEPLHIGALTIDLSPTKHVIFLVLAGVLLTVIFGLVGRAMRNKYTDRAPHGFANAMEAIVLFFRN